jgi:hypothetical protein
MRSKRVVVALLALAAAWGWRPAVAQTPLVKDAPLVKDVPYVPTPPEVVERMIQMAGVKSGDVLYDRRSRSPGCAACAWTSTPSASRTASATRRRPA